MKTMATKRLFVALELPHNIREYLLGICHEFAHKKFFEGKCVPLEQLHLTLKFIGTIDEENVVLIEQALSSIAFSPFIAKLGAINFFKKHGEISILYADLIAPQFSDLALVIDNALSNFVKPETRPFIAHVTLARIKKIADEKFFKEVMARIKNKPLSFCVNEFVLKESILSPEGARHSPLAYYQLK